MAKNSMYSAHKKRAAAKKPVRFDVPAGETPEETSTALINMLESILGRKLEEKPAPAAAAPPPAPPEE